MAAVPAIGSLFAVETLITNLEDSQKFYSMVFAWEFAPVVLPKATNNIKTLHSFTDASKSIKGTLLLAEGYSSKSAGKEGWSVHPTFIVDDVGEAIKKAEGFGRAVKKNVSSYALERSVPQWACILVCATDNTIPELRFLMAWA